MIIGNYNHSDAVSNFGRSQILTFERCNFYLTRDLRLRRRRPLNSDLVIPVDAEFRMDFCKEE